MQSIHLPGVVKRIVIVRIGKIGDLVVSNFAFRKIRAAWQEAEILLVTLPRNRELLKYNRSVNRVRYFRKGIDIIPLLAQIRSFRPDLFLDLNDNASRTSALLAGWCGAPVRVGFAFPNNSRYLTHPVECPLRDRTHITDRLRLIPEALGLTFQPEEVVPSMELGPRESEEVRLQLEPVRRDGVRCIAVNLSAGDRNRYWQTWKWKRLLEEIAFAGPPTMFVLLTAPGDEHLADEVRTPSMRVISPHRLSLHLFAAYIAQSDLLISPDTSAIHIASAFKVPVLGLYPAVEWNYASWHPIGTLFEVVRPQSGLVGAITPEQILAAFHQLEAERKSSSY
jgi:ADP-heptose:LPS heptosyltransferase